MAKSLRIFISSPGDVIPERRRAALVVEKLAKEYARFFDISPVLWETEPMFASGHFQDAIVPPGETDIVLMILWSRLGTALPEQKYRGIDGRVPVTGTEWEFETALAAHDRSGVPDLLAYRKKTPPKAEYRSTADAEELGRQLQKLEEFWGRYFVNRGEFLAAFAEFDDLDGLETRLEGDLRRLIERRVAAVHGDPDKSSPTKWMTGSPFRGLETYRFEHAPIFFGRSDATKTAVEHLVENAEVGRPFLLVLGASGAGKSSLAQAGVVPALGLRGVVPRVGKWRRAVMRPGGHPAGPFMALAAALADDNALPELLEGQDAAALAKHLEAAAANPSFPLVSALAAREQAAREQGDLLSFEQVRLILVVDQLEELFTLGEVTPDQRKAFILCLMGMMDQGHVFVVATMRSDYWHRAAEVPLLVTLAEGRGRLDLLPPTQAEIAEMIRRPAEAAGISFETDQRTEIGLDAALADEAAREPGALPLTSFLLDALYAVDVQRTGHSTLTFATMRALGGLKGAIATRAEAAITSLPLDVQAALPNVLRALVTVSRSGAEPTARLAPMSRFASGTAERAIVDALLDPRMRLVIAEGDGDGAHIRLAHEALITHWERARRQIVQDRDDLRTRAVVEEAEAEWRASDGRNKRGYLLRDPQLANAVDLERRWRDELEPKIRTFIAASRRRARVRQQITFAAAAIFGLVAIAAFWAQRQASFERDRAETATQDAVAQRQQAVVQRQEALAQRQEALAQRVRADHAADEARLERDRATTEEAQAKEARNRALGTQSRLLAERAARLTEQGDTLTAILLSLEAFRSSDDVGPERYESAAEKSLADALYRHSLEFILLKHGAQYTNATYTYDGAMLVTVDGDGLVSLWTADVDGRPKTREKRPDLGHVESVIANPKQPLLLFHRSDKSYFAWDHRSKEPLKGVAGKCDDEDAHFEFDPTGERLFVFCNQTIRIIILSTGRIIAKPGPFSRFSLSGDGKRFVTLRDKTKVVEVWNATTGGLVKSWNAPDADKLFINHDGEVVLTTFGAYRVRLWKSTTGAVLVGNVASQTRSLDVYVSPAKGLFATSGDDGIRVWDDETGTEIQHLTAGVVQDFLPNGLLAVRDGPKITLWEYVVESRLGHYEPKQRAVLYANEEHKLASTRLDGNRMLTLTDSGNLYIWRTEPPMLLRANDDAGQCAGSVSLSGDGKMIAAVTSLVPSNEYVGLACKSLLPRDAITLWNADTLAEIKRLDLRRFDKVESVRLSGDGQRLLIEIRPKGTVKNKQEGDAEDGPTAYEVVDVASGKRLFPPQDRVLWARSADISRDGETVAVADGSSIEFWRVSDGSKLQNCNVGTHDLVNVTYNESSRVALFGDNGEISILEPETCVVRRIPLFPGATGDTMDLVFRNGLLAALTTVTNAATSKSAPAVQVFSERDDKIVLGWTGSPDADVGRYDVLSSPSRIIVGQASDQVLHVFDSMTRALLDFEIDSNGCCEPSAVIFFPDAGRMLTAWSERKASRLRVWRVFPTIDALRTYAKNSVSECLSAARRKDLGLDPEPPRWCIELGKTPYDTPAWKQWRAGRDSGANPALPQE